MIKTGFISLIIHVTVGIATFFAFTIFISFVGIVNLIFKNNELIYQIASRVISIPLFVSALILYFVLGRKFLNKGSKLQNISVFIVSFIGIALWIVSFNLSSGV